jgi:hypothetical protein
MKNGVLVLLILLSACTINRRPAEENEEPSSRPTTYGQVSVSGSWASDVR